MVNRFQSARLIVTSLHKNWTFGNREVEHIQLREVGIDETRDLLDKYGGIDALGGKDADVE